MFQRLLSTEILEASRSFYALAVVGPRQSGKTTLLKSLFPSYKYINLEEPDTLARIRLDPRGFFDNNIHHWIIDEAQEYPELFSFLLGIIDTYKIKGQFILSGSKNFVLLEKISQSLAGRIAILELLPLTYSELKTEGSYANEPVWDLLYQGSYPGPYHDAVKTELWYKSYIETYLHRDVRQLLQVKDLSQFHLFLKLCAGRNAKVLNYSELGSICGVSHTTIKSWINILELSYIIFTVSPYYKNFNKRLVKAPKLYFYDPGLVCHLLGIESGSHLALHSDRGSVFEGYIVSEIMKQFCAKAKKAPLYFWGSQNGFEVDILIDQGSTLQAVEIKSSATFSSDFLIQLKKWQNLSEETASSKKYLIYSGIESFSVSDISIVSYKDIDNYLTF